MPKSSRKHSKVLNLKCLPGVNERLDGGMSIQLIVAYVREQGECLDITEASLRTALYRYKGDRASIEDAELAREMSELDLDAFEQMAGHLVDGVDPVESATALLSDQVNRLRMLRALEVRQALMNPRIDKAYSEVRATLKLIHDVAMDSSEGEGRNLGTMTVRPELVLDVESRHGAELAQLAQDSVAGAKVLAVISRLKSLGDKSSPELAES